VNTEIVYGIKEEKGVLHREVRGMLQSKAVSKKKRKLIFPQSRGEKGGGVGESGESQAPDNCKVSL